MPNSLMIGTGEYTTGYVHGQAATSDKKVGVVALTMFDLRRQGKLDRLLMAGTNGQKFPGIRQHFRQNVAEVYRDMDVRFDSFPADDVARDPSAYLAALDELSPGDVVAVFTPDDTHFEIALAAIQRRCHVLIAKPIVKSLAEHQTLMHAAAENGCLVAMEVHKRWDPIYRDAKDRIAGFGEFSFFNSYMSQPKTQLDTFRAWAGKSSDISYYLNAHHIDFNAWAVAGTARPVRVYASAATGVATSRDIQTEDTITLTVTWENIPTRNLATAIYTSSWIAPRSDVHSQQRFFYMGHDGEISIDQAHRGYSIATDQSGFASPNPLFMKYTPDSTGAFSGQSGYGYQSIADFVAAAASIQSGTSTPSDYRSSLATIEDTIVTTAILEAGRMSLDEQKPLDIAYDSDGQITSLSK
ncbi:MAG: Gfo/Idh/MocA family oxidoreductase [Planctomycetales bacterium]|nr:Gfo/Idh/MocA family oxidoreductase [Planctomycetales bacterium]